MMRNVTVDAKPPVLRELISLTPDLLVHVSGGCLIAPVPFPEPPAGWPLPKPKPHPIYIM